MRPFHVIASDPPWSFQDRLPGDTRGAESNYGVLPLGDIVDFKLPPIADDAVLFLWRVSAMVEEAYQVVRAWGFTPKAELVWRKLTVNNKPHFGMGRYVRMGHETCIIATRGRCPVADRSVRSVFEAPVGRHSAKPDAFFDIVQRLYPTGPYLEVFARVPRRNWWSIGNDSALLRAA